MLYDEAMGALLASRVAEAAARGSWVVVGAHKLAGRAAFLERLHAVVRSQAAREAREGRVEGSGGEAGTEPLPQFGHVVAVRSEALKWKEKRTELMLLNTPGWAVESGAL